MDKDIIDLCRIYDLVRIHYHVKFRFSKKATKFETIPHMIWCLLSKCQITWEIVSNFCGLFRMYELYELEKILVTRDRNFHISFLEVLGTMNILNHPLEKPWWYHLDGPLLLAIVEILELSGNFIYYSHWKLIVPLINDYL